MRTIEHVGGTRGAGERVSGVAGASAHDWRCPVVMKTDPDRVAYTCARCGEVAIVAAEAVPAADPEACPRGRRAALSSSWGDGRASLRRRSPNCLYLGDAVLVRAEGTPAFVGTVVAFDGPAVEIVTAFRPSAHAGTQVRRRVPWECIRERRAAAV
jgi:hypothetical protein